MTRGSFVGRVVVITVFALCFLSTATAQYNAAIQGTVTDTSGAVVPGATVTATNQQTGIASKTVSGDAGTYRIPGLIPGNYTVTAEANSFKKLEQKDVIVEAERVRGLELKLQPGAVEQNVTVAADVVTLQTENANVTGTISNQMIKDLPQFGRDPYETVRLAPGVFGDGSRASNGTSNWLPNAAGGGGGDTSGIFNQENQVQITANGQRPSANNFTIDGTSVNSLTWGGAAIITPNQESVQEIAVSSASYSAEDGRNTGAQVKVISKNGTNQFHGSAFFKYNEPGLNSNNKWGGPDPGELPQRVNQKLRQFGGSIGGPIWKDKLFFFFSYEGNRQINRQFSTAQWVPTSSFLNYVTANRSGTFISQELGLAGSAPRIVSVLPTTTADCQLFHNQGYTNCTALGAAGVDLGSPFGTAGTYDNAFSGPVTLNGGGLDGAADLQKVQLLTPATSHGNQYNGRVDYVLGKNTFAVSGYVTPRNDVVAITPNPVDDLNFQPRNKYIAFLWNRTFSPTLLNEFRVNATRFSGDALAANPQTYWGIPRIEIETMPAGSNRIVWGPPASDNTPGIFSQNQFEIRDNASKNWGRHNLKAGLQVNINQDNNNTMFGSSRPTFVYHGIWNFVNNAPIYEGINADPVTGAPFANHKYFRETDWAWFVQDDFKVRPNLTLNIGLRWDYFAPLSEKYGRLSNAFLGSGANAVTDAVVKTVSQLYEPDRNNFAPRIGFSWSPWASENKTVVRGGFGVAYNRTTDTLTGISRVNPPYVYRYGLCCASSQADATAQSWVQPPFMNGQIDVNQVGTNYKSFYNYSANPVLANNIDPSTNLPISATAGIEIWGAPQNLRTPYTYTYSFEVQRELPSKFIGVVGYQGSASHKLIRVVNENKVYAVGSGQRIGAMYFPSSDVNANYNSLNVSVTRPFSHGLEILSKYRWSKSIDEGSAEGAGQNRDPFFPMHVQSDRGPSDYDATHSISATVLYDLPFFKGRNDFLGKALGGFHVDGTYTFHSGFPWSPVGYGSNCPQVPNSGGNVCPNLPSAYFGGAGSSYSNATFMQPGGNFPRAAQNNGWQQYFALGAQPIVDGFPVPGIGRNSFRGPRYRAMDLSLAKNTRFTALGRENMGLDFRVNFFNFLNQLNLTPFQGLSASTIVSDSAHFGQAQSALAGRVIEFQTRFSF